MKQSHELVFHGPLSSSTPASLEHWMVLDHLRHSVESLSVHSILVEELGVVQPVSSILLNAQVLLEHIC